MSRAVRLPAMVRAIRGGDRGALARAISAVERRDPEVRAVLGAVFPLTGRARVIGIAGPLGVGKSSILNTLIAHLRSCGESVAVVAVDPSSPFSGGSLLGDRIRLDRDPEDDGVFIRSMASRGHPGGLALATRETVRLLDAAGFQNILVETVGSGQVDIEVGDVASTSVVVLVPHLGDEVQTLKAGLFEIADVFCVNKSDLAGADRARRDLSDLVSLGQPRDGWTPVIVGTSTLTALGISELWEAILRHERHLDGSGLRAEKERRRFTDEIAALLRDRLAEELLKDPSLPKRVEEVVQRRQDPETAARRWYRARYHRA